MLARNIAEPQRDLLETGDPQSLPLLEDLHEVARFDERSMGAGVEPGEAAAENLDEQVAALEIGAVDVGDFELAAAGRFDRRGDVDDVIVIEIEAGHREVRLGQLRLLLDRARASPLVELDHTIMLRFINGVAEHRRPSRDRGRAGVDR